MLREIRLYGKLGERFGRVHYFAVQTTGEAVRALCANFPDFERFLTGSELHYKVFMGRETICTNEAFHLTGSDDKKIKIVPVIQGAKRGGLFGILAGAALLAFAFFAPVSVTGLTLFGSTTIGSLATSIGFSLVLGGVSQLLAPSPKSGLPSERPENKPSYVFDGAVNTTAQGQPVPLGYGRMIVGSARISAGIIAEEIAV